jgi:hypothetical protein
VSGWTKCVAKEGHYVEKWCSCKFFTVVVLILKIHCGYFPTDPRKSFCLLHCSECTLLWFISLFRKQVCCRTSFIMHINMNIS